MANPNSLYQVLKTRLHKAKRIAVLGIGSDLRADDGAGVFVASRLEKSLAGKKTFAEIKTFLGATAPENLTGEIRSYKPNHILLIDTIEMAQKCGTILVLRPEMLADGISFSTHKLPAKVLIDYFTASLKCGVTIIGIQPKTVRFGRPMTATVKDSAMMIVDAIRSAVEIRSSAKKSLKNR